MLLSQRPSNRLRSSRLTAGSYLGTRLLSYDMHLRRTSALWIVPKPYLILTLFSNSSSQQATPAARPSVATGKRDGDDAP